MVELATRDWHSVTVSLAGNAAVHRKKNQLPHLICEHGPSVVDRVLYVHPEYLFDATAKLPAWCQVINTVDAPELLERAFKAHLDFYRRSGELTDKKEAHENDDGNTQLFPPITPLKELASQDIKYEPLLESLATVTVHI